MVEVLVGNGGIVMEATMSDGGGSVGSCDGGGGGWLVGWWRGLWR